MSKPRRVTREEALEYHARKPHGKIEVVPTKPTATQRDLAMAYSPGVAEPCLEIQKNPDLAYTYTIKDNLVGVVTNGTAVLGLGHIGPLAGKPVMEGKGVLFKRFADINVFDIEVDQLDADKFVEIVAALEPTFGGINLEDIKAPECFYIEEKLKARMQIPVFHDDQHGTAIISTAALLNALEVAKKRPEKVKVVISGAGASAIASATMYLKVGVRRENIVFVDSKGVVFKGRTDGMNPYKEAFASDTKARTLAEAMDGADVFVGLSAANVVKPEMLRSMAKRPIVFALANPDPEIAYDLAKETRPDLIMGTGRSDHPNQINNVLGFPFIFRGALDVRARQINEEMKLAASKALAALAKEDVPDSVIGAYGGDAIRFGPEYLIPKPVDPRVLLWLAPAVAKAAMDTGVARRQIDLDKYRDELEARLGKQYEMMRVIRNKARRDPKRIVFPEGHHEKILRACQVLHGEGIAVPILLGDKDLIEQKRQELGLDFPYTCVDPWIESGTDLGRRYAEHLYRKRGRKGVTSEEARRLVRDRNYFAALMVELGDADGYVSGINQYYAEGLRPALEVIGVRAGERNVVGCYMLSLPDRVLFLADATVNIEPDADDLAEIAMAAANVARKFDQEPRIAMLSFSNFGSSRHPLAQKVAQATQKVKQLDPTLMVDGEMQADTAVAPEIREGAYAFSSLKGPANVLVFPSLESANTAYKLLQRLADAEMVGPILEGMDKACHVLQRGDQVEDIVNIAAICVVDAQVAQMVPRAKRTPSIVRAS